MTGAHIVLRDNRYLVVVDGVTVARFPRTLKGRSLALAALRNPPARVIVGPQDLNISATRVAAARAKLDRMIPDVTGREFRMEGFQN